MVEGFFKADIAPLPKSQNQAVGLPVEASEKLTTSGEQPAAGEAVKLACGACALTNKVSHTQNSVRMEDLRFNFSQFTLFQRVGIKRENAAANHQKLFLNHWYRPKKERKLHHHSSICQASAIEPRY